MKRIEIILAVTAMLCAVALQSCQTDKPYRRYEGFVWGTTFHITYSSNVNLDDSIMSVMKTVDKSLSPFNKESLISQINAGMTDETDLLFRTVFDEAQEITRISHGAFDPTLASVVDLWGFGPSGVTTAVPTEAMIDSARRYVGMLDCRIDSVTNRIVKKSPKTSFDFSSIAKGYGCDLIGQLFDRNGVDNYIIEVGGEVVVKGHSVRQTPWRVMVDAPIANDTALVHDGIGIINLLSGTIATSGDYRNYHVMDDGTRATHIIDPTTGHPAKSEILSVTVLASSCIVADGYATAAMVLPLDSAKAMIDAIDGVEAMFVSRDVDKNTWVITSTADFPEVVR